MNKANPHSKAGRMSDLLEQLRGMKRRVWWIEFGEDCDPFVMSKEPSFPSDAIKVTEGPNLLPALIKAVEVLEHLKTYADNIQRNHPEECAHGCGESLLGQLASSVSTETYYALSTIARELNLEGERG